MVDKTLPDDLESLGKMLACGTHKQIAYAMWKNEKSKKALVDIVKKEVERECSELCLKKKPSILRNTGKKDMMEERHDGVNNGKSGW